MNINQHPAAQNLGSLSLTLTAFALAMGGCGEPSTPDIPAIESFGTDGSHSGGTGGGGDADAGVDETAGENDPNPGQCLIEQIGDLVGERYQCRGQFEAFFGADGAEESPYTVTFGQPGSGDSYDKPFVSACCGPLVEMQNCPGGDVNQHLWACTIDAAQQMCAGLGTKIEEVRNNVPPAQAFIKPSLADLRDWLNQASSISECMNTFIIDTGLATFDCTEDPSTFLENVTWKLSDTDHGLIKNPYLRIGLMEVVDVDKPEVGEPCIDLHDNDDYIPLEIGPDEPGWTKLVLASGTATVKGPVIDGTVVTGSAGLTSLTTGCEGKGCSSMSANLQLGPGRWQLEGLQLHSADAATAGNESTSIVVDEYTISLFSPVEGFENGGSYEIAPGAATFSLSGRTAFGNYSLATANVSKIVLQSSPNGWVVPPFELSYIDHNGDDWRLIIDVLAWAPSPPQ